MGNITKKIFLWYMFINTKRIIKFKKKKKTIQPWFELPTCWLQDKHHNHYTTEIRHQRLGQMVICYLSLPTRFGQISWIFPSFRVDDVYIKLSVTNQLSKICTMHFEILVIGHLKLHEQPNIQAWCVDQSATRYIQHTPGPA